MKLNDDMSIQDTLNELFDLGCGPVMIGRPGAHERGPHTPDFFAKAQLNVPTGSLGNIVNTELQGAGASIVEAVERLQATAKSVARMKKEPATGVLVPPNGKMPPRLR